MVPAARRLIPSLARTRPKRLWMSLNSTSMVRRVEAVSPVGSGEGEEGEAGMASPRTCGRHVH